MIRQEAQEEGKQNVRPSVLHRSIGGHTHVCFDFCMLERRLENPWYGRKEPDRKLVMDSRDSMS